MTCEPGPTSRVLGRGRWRAGVSALKIALVHDWLTGMRGGEKCLEARL